MERSEKHHPEWDANLDGKEMWSFDDDICHNFELFDACGCSGEKLKPKCHLIPVPQGHFRRKYDVSMENRESLEEEPFDLDEFEKGNRRQTYKEEAELAKREKEIHEERLRLLERELEARDNEIAKKNRELGNYQDEIRKLLEAQSTNNNKDESEQWRKLLAEKEREWNRLRDELLAKQKSLRDAILKDRVQTVDVGVQTRTTQIGIDESRELKLGLEVKAILPVEKKVYLRLDYQLKCIILSRNRELRFFPIKIVEKIITDDEERIHLVEEKRLDALHIQSGHLRAILLAGDLVSPFVIEFPNTPIRDTFCKHVMKLLDIIAAEMQTYKTDDFELSLLDKGKYRVVQGEELKKLSDQITVEKARRRSQLQVDCGQDFMQILGEGAGEEKEPEESKDLKFEDDDYLDGTDPLSRNAYDIDDRDELEPVI